MLLDARLSLPPLMPLRASHTRSRVSTQTGAAARRTRRFGGCLERFEEAHRRLRGEVFVVVVVDLDHRGVDAGAEAFYLGECE